MNAPKEHGPRRQLKSRDTAWARSLAKAACASGITPNAISILSMVFAAVAWACFYYAPDMPTATSAALSWIGAVACIQLRLVCNLMDGMVAVEGGKASLTGPIYNEAPDRIADVLILVGAGYSTNVAPEVIKLFDALPLGWTCALLAMGTAYLRLLQGTLTGQQSFMGPMAKQHRMAVLTIGTLIAAGEQWLHPIAVADHHIHGIKIALIIIAVGAVVTCLRRLSLTVSLLKKASL
ncbi:MAG: CDP-alcohol phosphatidyltransferase family protein [Verrucomicrobia bacterium]|nr:CDP-alcohol phosphatidyltransferase family protein [Verrucomicrobiota bacterium]